MKLARFWHKTGVPLSILMFQIKKKYTSQAGHSTFYIYPHVFFILSNSTLASFVPVSCQFLASLQLLLGIELWIFLPSRTLSHLVHRPINIIIKEFCKKCYLNLYYLFILRFKPETNKFFLKNILIVHKQKLTQKCQNSSKNLNFLLYNFRLYG